MKKILVPTDFSECANVASETAIKLAKNNDAEIVFLHYMTIPIDWIHLQYVDERLYPDVNKMVKNANSKLDELVNEADKEDVVSRHFIAYNEDISDIPKYFKQFDIDQVVMGSQGAKGAREFFLGSNAQRIIRQSNIPVLIVKHKLDHISKPTIVFVSDYELERLTGFRKIVEFADAMKANIQLLYINTPDNFLDTWTINEKMQKFLELTMGGTLRTHIIDAIDFESGLAKYLKGVNGGIVAMVSHQIGILNRDTKAESLVNHLENPVLNVKD
ncbi:MAG: universal stress protein [Bacteroidota bacterium]